MTQTLSSDQPIAWFKGGFIPASECRLAIYDAGIVIGASVTDLLRTYAGKAFRVEDHIRRFFESARYAYLDLGMTEECMAEIVEMLISHNLRIWAGREIAVVFYATAGEMPVYAGSAGAAKGMQPTVCIHAFPLPLELWTEAVKHGVHVVTPAQHHFHPGILSSKIKNRNRLHMWIGDHQAKLADPKAIGLYLDLNGNVTETGGSNFLILKGDTVVSPERSNILWGTSLQTVSELCPEVGLRFIERDIQIHDVVNADEAWLSSTPYFLLPATRINGISIGDGAPGPYYQRLMRAFSETVGFDALAQIQNARNAGSPA